MSVSPKDGVLNSFCQTHDIPNLYVFGGNAFPSTGDKHPTLTMMALSARGCDHLLETAKGRRSHRGSTGGGSIPQATRACRFFPPGGEASERPTCCWRTAGKTLALTGGSTDDFQRVR